jgi:hypothetical protein
MARAILTSQKALRPPYEPLYDIDPWTGATIEVFFAERVLAQSFGANGAGWFWWSCHSGALPHELPTGPFANSYLAYRDVATRWTNTGGPAHHASAESGILQ